MEKYLLNIYFSTKITYVIKIFFINNSNLNYLIKNKL